MLFLVQDPTLHLVSMSSVWSSSLVFLCLWCSEQFWRVKVKQTHQVYDYLILSNTVVSSVNFLLICPKVEAVKNLNDPQTVLLMEALRIVASMSGKSLDMGSNPSWLCNVKQVPRRGRRQIGKWLSTDGLFPNRITEFLNLQSSEHYCSAKLLDAQTPHLTSRNFWGRGAHCG